MLSLFLLMDVRLVLADQTEIIPSILFSGTKQKKVDDHEFFMQALLLDSPFFFFLGVCLGTGMCFELLLLD